MGGISADDADLTLDERFGELVTPIKVGAGEALFTPKSLQKLDKSSADLLRALMVSARDGNSLAITLFAEMPILWVVDADGEIWFSLEEVVNPESGQYLFPLARNRVVRSAVEVNNLARLGHPALVSGAAARIGGEILYDDGDPQCWVISNNSGRYGRTVGRTEQHLENVRLSFLDLGIDLVSHFVPANSR